MSRDVVPETPPAPSTPQVAIPAPASQTFEGTSKIAEIAFNTYNSVLQTLFLSLPLRSSLQCLQFLAPPTSFFLSLPPQTSLRHLQFLAPLTSLFLSLPPQSLLQRLQFLAPLTSSQSCRLQFPQTKALRIRLALPLQPPLQRPESTLCSLRRRGGSPTSKSIPSYSNYPANYCRIHRKLYATEWMESTGRDNKAFEAHWKALGSNEKKVSDKLSNYIIFSDILPVSRQRPMPSYATRSHFSLYLEFSQPLSQRQLAK